MNDEKNLMPMLPEPRSHEVCQLHGGPMDGLEIALPTGEPVVYEIRLANGHCRTHERPFWEAIYTRRRGSLMLTASTILHPDADFDYVPGSQFLEIIAAIEQTLESVRAKLCQRERQVNRLQGQIKAWKTKWAKRKK